MKQIVATIAKNYGADAITGPAELADWGARKLAEVVGATVAGKEWRKLNAKRGSLGRPCVYPQYGDDLFAAYFAK